MMETGRDLASIITLFEGVGCARGFLGVLYSSTWVAKEKRSSLLST